MKGKIIPDAAWRARYIAQKLRLDWSLVPELQKMLASFEMNDDIRAELLIEETAKAVYRYPNSATTIPGAIASELTAQVDPTPYFQKCGSPIEELFLIPLLTMHSPPLPEQCNGDDLHIEPGSCGGFDSDEASFCYPGAGIVVFQQYEVELSNGYARLDFALQGDLAHVATEWKVAIELDGHDFHERTKEQAKRDRSRDRELTELGWRVLRFTGSEIWADARKCAEESVRIAWSLHKEAFGRDQDEWRKIGAAAVAANSGPISSSGSNEESIHP